MRMPGRTNIPTRLVHRVPVHVLQRQLNWTGHATRPQVVRSTTGRISASGGTRARAASAWINPKPVPKSKPASIPRGCSGHPCRWPSPSRPHTCHRGSSHEVPLREQGSRYQRRAGRRPRSRRSSGNRCRFGIDAGEKNVHVGAVRRRDSRLLRGPPVWRAGSRRYRRGWGCPRPKRTSLMSRRSLRRTRAYPGNAPRRPQAPRVRHCGRRRRRCLVSN